MKKTHRCPKCQHGSILYIAQIADRYGETRSRSGSMPMRIAHYDKQMGEVLGLALTRTEQSGELEAGVCRQCGYTEFYVKDPGEIVIDGTYVRELVATESYR